MIRVLTVDDHSVVRAGIAAMIANETDIFVVAEAANGEEAVARYAEHHRAFTSPWPSRTNSKTIP